MTNMYSMSMGYGSNMMGSMMASNMNQYFKNKYGQEQDFMYTPYVMPLPVAVIPKGLPLELPKSAIGRYFDKTF